MLKSRTFISAVIAIAGLTIAPSYAKAQTTCEPPQAGEYLLLIVTDTGEKQEQVRRSLPNDVRTSVCQYVNDTVTRVAGFRNPQLAANWAQYVQRKVGLAAYIISGNPASSPPPSNLNPQPLGPGYAVLVDYLNQPEVANQLRQVLGVPLALVSYGQRRYLLISYTTDKNIATSTLQNLSDRGFSAMLVDGRRVTPIGSVAQ